MLLSSLILTAAAMLFISLAHHLGLIEKVAGVCSQIAACSMCSTFWGVLSVLLLTGVPVLWSACLALGAAYLSLWLGLLWGALNKLHTRIWKRQQRRVRQSP